jgi:hypothetical protein
MKVYLQLHSLTRNMKQGKMTPISKSHASKYKSIDKAHQRIRKKSLRRKMQKKKM